MAVNHSGTSASENRGVMQAAPVSVIIPCYNCARTIERAVASVCAQSLRPAEILLINDASCDDTAGVLKALAERHAGWVSVYGLSSNSGPSTARNTGWSKATQPYIAFLDADDSWHPRKIEIQYGWMVERPDVSLTAHRYTYDDTLMYELDKISSIASEYISFNRLLLSNHFSTPTVMLRSDMSERFQEGKRHAEDYLLWLSIAANYQCYFLHVSLTKLHKAPFGAAGLSAEMWEMEKGELLTYKGLCDKGYISRIIYMGLVPFSLLKFLLRLIRLHLKG